MILGTPDRTEQIQQFAVTAEQMQAIESRIFEAGMPVAALMEKVAGLVARRIADILSSPSDRPVRVVGILVGPGHNGGDALVLARELFFQGYRVVLFSPISKRKDLTDSHAKYAASLGIESAEAIASLGHCDLIVDGMFGFGQTRPIEGELAEVIETVNSWNRPVFSIDIPSGIHTDTGEVLGTAIRATRTFCLGLWKRAFLQDSALEWVGSAELVDFGIPLPDIRAVLGSSPQCRRITPGFAIAHLPIPRHPATHKYKQGHLLIVAGSGRYTGAAVLCGLGARSSGVGMLSIAVPESIKPLLSAQLPEALIVGCPETEDGAIASLPEELDLSRYDAIACGPGLTAASSSPLEAVLECDRPVVLDADGLNQLAQLGTISALSRRRAPTLLTPHPGEFKRLFPDLGDLGDRIAVTQEAARLSDAVVILKGARVCIATPETVAVNPESTPALARGGSGDVLTGLLGGLSAIDSRRDSPPELTAQIAVWWHARAGILAARDRTELGVDAFTLTQYLTSKELFDIS